MTSVLLPSKCSVKSKLARRKHQGGMYGVEVVAILSKLIPESRTLWCIRGPRVGMMVGLASNRRLKPLPKNAIKSRVARV